MYRDYEEYMRTTLGYNPTSNDMIENPYIDTYNIQINNINTKKDGEQKITDTPREEARPINSAPVKPKLEENRSASATVNNTNAVRNNNPQFQKNRRNTPATSYKNFLKF